MNDSKTARWIFSHATHKSDSCLIWPYGRDGGGYARASVRGYSTRLAHRIMCQIANGHPPTEQHVARHICGNGHFGCVNPRHLRWGTVAENSADMEAHGTKRFGEQTSLAVLDKNRVRKIRELISSGISQRKVAKMFGVSAGTIQAIAEGRTWGHVK